MNMKNSALLILRAKGKAHRSANSRGFTIIELGLVLAVMVTLMVLMAVDIRGNVQMAEVKQVVGNLKVLAVAAQSYAYREELGAGSHVFNLSEPSAVPEELRGYARSFQADAPTYFVMVSERSVGSAVCVPHNFDLEALQKHGAFLLPCTFSCSGTCFRYEEPKASKRGLRAKYNAEYFFNFYDNYALERSQGSVDGTQP